MRLFGTGLMIIRAVEEGSDDVDSDFIGRSQSVSTVLAHLMSHQSESVGPPRFASGPLGRFTGPVPARSAKMSDFLSDTLCTQSPVSGPLVAEKNKRFKFYSGPLGKITSKSGPLIGMGKHNKKMDQTPERPSVSSEKKQMKPNRLTQVGPFKGCMVSQDGITPLSTRTTRNGARNHIPNSVHVESRPPKLSDAAPNTLGAACLALHYANVIIVIERFVASPHLIGDDARDDLYNMLPASVRASLRERLKPYSKSLSSATVYDPGLAKEWTEAMAGILEWLGPLAHNMIKWQSERSYEHQSLVSRTHIVLAQTLSFANQQKTEAIITELLVGLNYVWRFGRELNAKALQECASDSITLEKCMDTDNY
ncbi:hypothetical protein F2Q69_00000179 [Brassica cretica]|uniref:DUF668 domain-containing protein n=1 Tax=Brassica cretica TaxID=69181 RepID=A0A8S9PNN6_BRACR|nr:hypothetical protein F2Q69_00000179 [Brassica cretica]